MKPERWQIIRRICEDALERKGADRDSFLTQACAGDEQLRAEVDSFLSGAAGKDGFIETPAIEIAAKGITKDQVRDAAPVSLPIEIGFCPKQTPLIFFHVSGFPRS